MRVALILPHRLTAFWVDTTPLRVRRLEKRNPSVVGFTTGPSRDLRCIFASRSQFGSRREKWKSGGKMRMQWSEESSQCPLSGGDGGGSDWTPGRTIPPSMARVRSFFCDHVP